MRNYYSIADTKYLPNLICLIDSINEKFEGDYNIHILALDETVSSFLSSKKRFKNVTIYDLKDVNNDFDIYAVRFLQPSNEAISNANSSGKDAGFVQFCWALAPCFGEWLINRIRSSITYIDADIIFYNDITCFFDSLEKFSIGFVSHRIPYVYSSGEYNVGIVHFSFDGPGISAIRRWKSFLTEQQNSYSLCFGTCGDQKYLEAIKLIYHDDVVVIDEKFGHLAPWNVTFHEYLNNKIIWKAVEQELVYFHFAHFVYESDSSYRASYNNEWIWGDPLKVNKFVNKLYDDYHIKIMNAKIEMS